MNMDQNRPTVEINKLTLMSLAEILEKEVQLIYLNYIKTGSLNNSEKSIICKSLIKYILDISPNQIITRDEFQYLTELLLMTFPNAKDISSTYYIPASHGNPARGKLFNAYHSYRKKLGVCKIINLRKMTKKLKGADSDDKVSPPIVEILEIFKTKTAPWSEIKQTWIETFTERSNVINNLQICPSEYLMDFVCLGLPNGYELAKIDALARYPNIQNIATSNWDTITEKIMAKGASGHHNPHLERLYQTFGCCFDSRIRQLGAFLMLPYIVRTANIKNGKRPSKVEVQESFIIHFKTESEAQQYELDLKEKENPAEPHIVVIGPSLTSIERSYFIVADRQYFFEDFFDAIESCFYYFAGFQIKYPAKCYHIWYFLQIAIFKVKYDSQQRLPAIECLLNEFDVDFL